MWPALRFTDWKDTCATLHMWTQIVGKIRLTLTPWVNHSWHVTLYTTPRGLTTSVIPYDPIQFQIDFDFLDHRVVVQTSDGKTEYVQLRPRSVADFYQELFAKLKQLRIDVKIHNKPNEVAAAIPFTEDNQHASYDPDYAHRCWQILLNVDRVFKDFRARFIGKCSPVHFYWGSFDLAVSRFSGRTAPEHPGNIPNLPDSVTREAYSHEVCSAGFWPGSEQMPNPLFFSYAYPEPTGYKDREVHPAGAIYDSTMKEFVLPYDAIRESSEPGQLLMDFLQSTYVAAAECGNWDRSALEKNFEK